MTPLAAAAAAAAVPSARAAAVPAGLGAAAVGATGKVVARVAGTMPDAVAAEEEASGKGKGKWGGGKGKDSAQSTAVQAGCAQGHQDTVNYLAVSEARASSSAAQGRHGPDLELEQRVRAGAHADGGRARRGAAALRRMALCWHRGRQRRAGPVESPDPACCPCCPRCPGCLGSLQRRCGPLLAAGELVCSRLAARAAPLSPRGEASPLDLGCHRGSKRSDRQARKVSSKCGTPTRRSSDARATGLDLLPGAGR